MANKRPPNPNTAYGRKRQREEYHRAKAALSPEDRAKQNTNEVLYFLLILGFIVLIIYIFGGSGALSQWFQH